MTAAKSLDRPAKLRRAIDPVYDHFERLRQQPGLFPARPLKHLLQGRVDLEEPPVEQDRRIVQDRLNQSEAPLHQFDLS